MTDLTIERYLANDGWTNVAVMNDRPEARPAFVKHHMMGCQGQCDNEHGHGWLAQPGTDEELEHLPRCRTCERMLARGRTVGEALEARQSLLMPRV